MKFGKPKRPKSYYFVFGCQGVYLCLPVYKFVLSSPIYFFVVQEITFPQASHISTFQAHLSAADKHKKPMQIVFDRNGIILCKS